MADVKPATLKKLQSENSTLKCEVPECFNRRNGMGKLCSKHRHRLNNTGSVRERSLKYKTYWREVEEVRALFDENPGHKATEAAVKWIAKWLELAVYAPEVRENGFINRIPARPFVRRLADEQVDPQECLEHIAGCWCYMARHPEKYDTRRSYIIGLGGAFLQVKPIPSKEKALRLKTRSRTEAGEHIFQALLPILVRINEACLKRRKDTQGMQKDLREPWAEVAPSSWKAIEVLKKKRRRELAKQLNARTSS